ncbi:MAG: sulfatase [Phycisphaeraceae bacterium]
MAKVFILIRRSLFNVLAVLCLCAGTTTARADDNPAGQSERPNVLFIIADDLGARLGCYGEPGAVSPNLDRLAKRGVLFERCYAQRPTCGPSRMSMLSGLYPYQSGLHGQNNRIGASRIKATSLPHLFRKKGYYTARVGKVFHMSISKDMGKSGADDTPAWDEFVNNTGWDTQIENINRSHTFGTRKNHGVRITYFDPPIASEEMADGVGTQHALRIMKERHPDKTGKPLMLFMGYYRPHPPMIAPRRHWDAIEPDGIVLPEVPEDDRDDIPDSAFGLISNRSDFKSFHFIPEAVGEAYTHAYYAAIHFIDGEVQKLLDGLKANGLDDNTIVVFTGDQGFHLGEHGYWHKTSSFEESFHVPLIIYDPRSAVGGTRVSGLTGLIDLYPTLCELAGLDPEHQLSGQSLVPMLNAPDHIGKPWELTELSYGMSLRTDRFRFSKPGNGKDYMLYDLHNDPNEWTNLIGEPKWAEVEAELRSIMEPMLKQRFEESDR